eukprot:3148934-Pyramimonas_sp.AAC.1
MDIGLEHKFNFSGKHRQQIADKEAGRNALTECPRKGRRRAGFLSAFGRSLQVAQPLQPGGAAA